MTLTTLALTLTDLRVKNRDFRAVSHSYDLLICSIMPPVPMHAGYSDCHQLGGDWWSHIAPTPLECVQDKFNQLDISKMCNCASTFRMNEIKCVVLWSCCLFSKFCYALEFLVFCKNLILQWLTAPLCQKFWAESAVRNKSTSLLHSNQFLPATPLFRSVYVALTSEAHTW